MIHQNKTWILVFDDRGCATTNDDKCRDILITRCHPVTVFEVNVPVEDLKLQLYEILPSNQAIQNSRV
jgi:hypothetical protein